MHQLVLQEVTLDSSGVYMCQITESKPPFHTEQRERNLTVISKHIAFTSTVLEEMRGGVNSLACFCLSLLFRCPFRCSPHYGRRKSKISCNEGGEGCVGKNTFYGT